jgi:hypothetical protein
VNWVALLSALLNAAASYLKWQAALAKITARKQAYDIDQECLRRGRDLEAQIDKAHNAKDLAAASRLLDDYQANALYAANIRSALPDDGGRDNLGVSSGVPKIAAPSRGPKHSSKPNPSAK